MPCKHYTNDNFQYATSDSTGQGCSIQARNLLQDVYFSLVFAPQQRHFPMKKRCTVTRKFFTEIFRKFPQIFFLQKKENFFRMRFKYFLENDVEFAQFGHSESQKCKTTQAHLRSFAQYLKIYSK